jgi:hypothetical protein
MIASLLVFAISVQPLPPPEAEAPPVTPTEAARAWLAALRDGKGDRLAALTAYPFRWSATWHPHVIRPKGARRGPRPFAGRHESCPTVVKRAPLMPVWQACMWRQEVTFVGALRFERARTGSEALSVALESPSSPGTAPRRSSARIIWALASLTGPNRTVAIRIGVRPGDAGPRVERLQVTVDWTYVDVEKRHRILIR